MGVFRLPFFFLGYFKHFEQSSLLGIEVFLVILKGLQSLQDLAVSLVSFQFFVIPLIYESLHMEETSHCDDVICRSYYSKP